MHTLVGAGKADGAMDASNLLKPALARGELHCVGATTLDEYRKHVEKDAALARRFQPVFVGRADGRGHGLDPARAEGEIRAAPQGAHLRFGAGLGATLSNRYITDRFLPDKAIDLVDEAASRLRMQVDSKPEELDEVDRRIMQLKIEREALKKEKDEASKDRLARLEKELAGLEEESAAMTATWQAEKEKLGLAAELKRSSTRRATSSPSRSAGEFQRAGELAYGIIPNSRSSSRSRGQEEGARPAWSRRRDARHVAHIVSRWTGIPVDKMLEGERDKLLRMEDEIGSASSARARRCRPSPRPCAARAPACRIPTGRSAPSCSSAPPASARPS
jgi:ATP-dependent Clp protease ATP-binding subunit ClpB